jgi:hypothetical protein
MHHLSFFLLPWPYFSVLNAVNTLIVYYGIFSLEYQVLMPRPIQKSLFILGFLLVFVLELLRAVFTVPKDKKE